MDWRNLFRTEFSGGHFLTTSQSLNGGHLLHSSEHIGFSNGTRLVEISYSCTTRASTIRKYSSALLRLKFASTGHKNLFHTSHKTRSSSIKKINKLTLLKETNGAVWGYETHRYIVWAKCRGFKGYHCKWLNNF
jgi:hypothetical protein